MKPKLSDRCESCDLIKARCSRSGDKLSYLRRLVVLYSRISEGIVVR